MYTNFDYENKYSAQGYRYVAGVDEVGRGALAGPLFSCAVILDRQKVFPGIEEIRDSKKISAAKRQKLSEIIKDNCLDYAFGRVEACEIDKIGIGPANSLSFLRAVSKLKNFDFALIDGREIKNFDHPHYCVIKGDDISKSIAAASVLAKVERDACMAELDIDGLYQFEQHAGYGTKKHIELIKRNGPGPYHRLAFLSKILSLE